MPDVFDAIAEPELIEPGNVDLTLRNNDYEGLERFSPIMVQLDNGKVGLIPTVKGFGVMTQDEAIAEYEKTGKHLGVFDSADKASSYADKLHESLVEQDKFYKDHPNADAADYTDYLAEKQDEGRSDIQQAYTDPDPNPALKQYTGPQPSYQPPDQDLLPTEPFNFKQRHWRFEAGDTNSGAKADLFDTLARSADVFDEISAGAPAQSQERSPESPYKKHHVEDIRQAGKDAMTAKPPQHTRFASSGVGPEFIEEEPSTRRQAGIPAEDHALVPPEVFQKANPLWWATKDQEGGIGGAVHGVQDAAANAMSEFTSPQSIGLLAVGGMAPKLIAGAFLGKQIWGTPEQWQAYREAPTTAEKFRIGTEMALGYALPALGMKAAKGLESKVSEPVKTTQEAYRGLDKTAPSPESVESTSEPLPSEPSLRPSETQFTPSTEWQEIPEGAVLPNGGHYNFDQATGKNYARWDEVPPNAGPSNKTAEEFSAPTSIKNEVTTAEREARGFAPAEQEAKRELGDAWDLAGKFLERDPKAGERLVAELNSNPRALKDDIETSVLLREQVAVRNEHDAATEAVNSNPGDPSAIARLESARNALQAVYDADKVSGTAWGRGGRARQMLANNDFTLARMEAEYRAVANDGLPLKPKQAAEVKALHEKISLLENKLSAHEARGSVREAMNAAKRSRKPFSPVKFLAEQEVKARARIAARRGKLYSDPLGVTNIAHLADETIIGAAHIARGVRDFSKWSAEMVKDFGEGIRPYLKALFVKSNSMHSEAQRLAAAKSRTVTQTVQTLRRIGANEFEPKRSTPVKPDKELVELRANLQRAKDEYGMRLEKARQANLSFTKKAANTFVKAERAIKLTGITTLGKLGGAGITRLATSPIEEAVGAILSKSPILRKVAAEAPREGGFNIKAELLAPTKGVAKGIRNAPRIWKGERTNEEALYGKPTGYETGSWLDIPGRTHAIIKSPFKEAERTRSTIKRQAFAEKKGQDVTEPSVEQEIGKAANMDAQRAIFMQDNILADWFNNGVRSLETSKKFPNAGFALAKVARFLFPIIKVPTNVAFETMTHVGGSLSASGKLIQVMRRGMDTIKPEEADMIMRHYKKGAVGAALFLTGYFNADKFGGFYQPGERRDPSDVKWGSMRINGVNVPAWLLHAPAFIVLQAGATARRVANMMHKGEVKGAYPAALAVTEGLTHEIPFMNEMSRIDSLLSESWKGTKARGDLLRSSVVPQGVQNIAGWMDEAGKEARRSPKTEWDYLKMGIPGLRKEVPFATR